MNRVLIISPYFPPSNAADMHRVRMSLPYFEDFGWEAEVVCVEAKYSEMVKDDLLTKSLPENVVVHQVSALAKKWTKKFGFGSLGFRSLWFYRKEVNRLLGSNRFDLVYFSTTQFPVCVLGAYWKRKFGIPYVIDMQDPWYNDYYQNKPKSERPPKYHLVYTLHKKMESMAMKKVGGLVSVAENYLGTLNQRYPETLTIPSAAITFGAFQTDFDLVKQYAREISTPALNSDRINCVYVGRGGNDMKMAISLIFEGFKIGLKKRPETFKKLHFYFLGTSYAPAGEGKESVLPIAKEMGIEEYVTEQTDRLPFYQTIATLMHADRLIIPGSDSPGYTASKIFPYIMAGKPLLAVFNQHSSAVKILKECAPASEVVTFPETSGTPADEINQVLQKWAAGQATESSINAEAFNEFSARSLTQKQVEVFNRVIAVG